LKDFIVYVRNMTRNGLFDEYQEIKSQPPDGVFDHVRVHRCDVLQPHQGHTCIKPILASRCGVFQNQPPADVHAFSGIFHFKPLNLVKVLYYILLKLFNIV
jgi:hypothetical protein